MFPHRIFVCGVFSTDTDTNMFGTSALSRSGFGLTISLDLTVSFYIQ